MPVENIKKVASPFAPANYPRRKATAPVPLKVSHRQRIGATGNPERGVVYQKLTIACRAADQGYNQKKTTTPSCSSVKCGPLPPLASALAI